MAIRFLDPHMWSIEDLFKNIYNVPVYQRPYSWEKIHVATLLDDIFEAYSYMDSTEDGYYTGNIIIHDRNEKVGDGLYIKYEIIDGQQRITTFALILIALYSLINKYKADPEDSTFITIKKCLWKKVKRNYDINLKLLTLNSVEKECFNKLFNKAYSDPINLPKYLSTLDVNSKFEKLIISNFNDIYDYLENKLECKNGAEEILTFADFFLERVNLIAVEAKAQENKVFSMFESINSKGKKLDEIDLIKSYIFSKLDEDSYQEYLDLWGQLIIKTEDNLYDYLQIFIKSYVVFYRQDIKIINFKTLSSRQLLSYYGVANEAEAFKCLLTDMNSKVEYYSMLSDTDEAYNLIRSNKLRFYYRWFNYIDYKHSRPLFFRIFNDFKNNKLDKNDAVDIVVEVVKYMILFLNIMGQPSKDIITLFSDISDEIIETGYISKEKIINRIAAEALKKGMNKTKLKQNLSTIDAFEKNKKVTIGLLSLYESSSLTNDSDYYVSYDQTYTLLNEFSNSFSLDHLLVQTPEVDDENFKYYKKITMENGAELVLKEGNDFPPEIVNNGMDYDVFTSVILNKIGNLRLYYKDQNSKRSNEALGLKEYADYNTYEKISKRGQLIVDTLIDNIFHLTDVDLSKVQINTKVNETSLPKMKDLIEAGLINVGDKLVITFKPDDSEATLLDSNTVEYNGKEMTLNEWGCLITGWKSIRIYCYCSKKGDDETLHQMRLRINDNNQ